ncbi:MAG TPA: hypothetical protein VNA89_00670 [Gemmatimonadaceae bacterium]|nr:hypothetical protein [Gemmatimonadaceae bacterium]
MTGPRIDIGLAATNLRLAHGLAPALIRTWDPRAWRGQRLLVPIIVEALVVTDKNAAGPWARVQFDPKIGPNTPSGVLAEPAPFEEYRGRTVGVHLHWALPDGLTRGTQVRRPSAAPAATPAAAGSGEKREPPPAESTSFPLVPDRWLVVRFYPGVGAQAKREMAAWVIESESERPVRRVTPVGKWQEDRTRRGPRTLTAVGKGDPAYAAYYDNVQNVLGFYDDLAGVPTGPLTYLVMGWYSSASDDPLFAPETRDAWAERLRELGWSLGDATPGRLDAAAAAARDRLVALGLTTEFQTRRRQEDPTVSELMRRKSERTGATAAATPVAGVGGVRIDPAIAALGTISADTIFTKQSLFTMYWPRQLLCHGMVYDIAWNRNGGQYNTAESGPPAAKSVGVAVGNTNVEAMSALLANRGQTPDLEKVYAAFHSGLLAELDEPDGLSRLEAMLHSDDFASTPGGFVTETIAEGDVFTDPARSETPSERARRADDAANPRVPEVRAAFSVSKASLNELVSAMRDRDPASDRGPRPRRMAEVSRAMPRYWRPNDPVVLLVQPKRSAKHGEDGMFAQDGTLVCRITGDPVKSLAPKVGTGARRLTILPTDMSAASLASGQLPLEAQELVGEALLLDESNAALAARAAAADVARLLAAGLAATAGASSAFVAQLERDIRVEQTLLWNPVANPLANATTVASESGITGKMPSKLAVQPWQMPWTPLHLDWEMEYHPSPRLERDWTLGQLDYEGPTGGDLGVRAPARAVFRGRSLLTPGVAAVLARQVTRFLEDEASGNADLATPAQEKVLGEVVAALRQIDVLATSLGGLHGQMMGRVQRPRFTRKGDKPVGEDTSVPSGAAEVFGVRAGHMRLTRLRIIDAFSQIYDVDPGTLAAPVRAADMVVPPFELPDPRLPPVAIGGGTGGVTLQPIQPPRGGVRVPPIRRVVERKDLMRLPPRIVQPSRLMFRFVAATSDDDEATNERSPVCGWVLPDHLDEALEVYDGSGLAQGQVQLQPDRTALEWEGVPGRPGPVGGMPTLPNGHLERLVRGLMSWGVRDTAAGVGTPERTESALSALLRMIDATLWTVDPLGNNGGEHLSLLVGRPLAVVRAQLRLELDDAPVTDELLRTAFPVRLGELTQLNDGLLGYFVNDDYSQFYPIHESIAAQTRPAGPEEGFLSGITDVSKFYSAFDKNAAPVSHPYINTAPVVPVRPQQKVMLTLLVDPRGAVHATAGIVPRKRIDLLRDHVAPALAAMALTFRIGPILTDPTTIRMPLPAEIRGGWSWVRRTGVTTWAEDPVVKATGDARLPDGVSRMVEGWLRLAGAMGDGPGTRGPGG